MKNITRQFPGVKALDNVEFRVRPNEIHALIGENGAGKSTLVKIINGIFKPDSGEILFAGKKVEIRNPQQAQELGISTIFQDLQLFPDISVAENILLGHEPKFKTGLIDWKSLYARAQQILAEMNFDLDTGQIVRKLSIAQKQLVMIARALSFNSRLIIMDEPTATLTSHEIDNLFRVIRELKNKGKTIVFISHKLEEIFEITENITVFRDGQMVGVLETKSTDKAEVIKLMVGRSLEEEFPMRTPALGENALVIRNLETVNKLRDINLTIRKGEVVGLFGLVGAGRTELARVIFGIDPIHSGQILLEGLPLAIKSPKDAINAGIAFATEDRKTQGLVLSMSVKENMTLPNLKSITRFSFIRRRAENEIVHRYIKTMNIKTPGIDQFTMKLSGGNQQKVVLARWLGSNPRVLILDEPTQGIDIGAKQEIYGLINEFIKKGMAIILISSELPEVLGICDRIYVMFRGRITSEFTRQEATPEKVMVCATGLTEMEN
ncbi:MAG: sugar ABC transporter ATP-binding protein [Candidatus Zhuqueibacterota bacterium]